MSSLKKQLFSILSQYPELPIIIAYSGGVDSQVLLSLVSSLKKEHQILNDVCACHVNHGLSQHADAWESFAKLTCERLNITFIPKLVTLNLNSSESLEAQARDARYNALTLLSKSPCLILTGHHKDDQAETFLLALKRGSGVKGLSAMKQISAIAHHVLARPLLNVTRAEIEHYARENKLEWIEDESNLDTRFDRNFIRQQVLPLLSERWPSIGDTINRSAEHCQQSQELLDELAEQDLAVCSQNMPYKSLDVAQLQTLSTARFSNVIRYFLTQHQCSMASTAQLEQIKLQLKADIDKAPQVKVGTKWLRRFRNVLYLTEEFKDVSNFSVDLAVKKLDGQKVILPDGLGQLLFHYKSKAHVIDDALLISQHEFSLSSLGSEVLQVQFTHQNDKVLPDYRHHHRSVKKVLQELNLPSWQRKRIPYIYANEQLIAATGHFVCQPFMPNNKTDVMCLFWLKSEQPS